MKRNKNINKVSAIVLMALLLLGADQLHAQDNGHIARQRLDSVQRQKLKDSLELTDNQITQLWRIRDQYRSATAAVYADAGRADAQRNAMFVQLRDQANAEVKKLLGAELFMRYLELINQSHQRRGIPQAIPSLTGVVQ